MSTPNVEGKKLDYIGKISPKPAAPADHEAASKQVVSEIAAEMREGEDLKSPFRKQPIKQFEKMPIGFWDQASEKFIRGFSIKELSAETLIGLDADEPNMFKTFGSIVAKGLDQIFDPDTGVSIDWRAKSSKIFFPDIMFLMTEILVKTRGASRVSTAYRCPQCKKYTKFENDPDAGLTISKDKGFDLLADEDTMSSLDMEDIHEVSFKEFDGKIPQIEVVLDSGVKLGGYELKTYVFRIPEIGDYLLKGTRYNGQLRMIERDVFMDCLLNIEEVPKAEWQKFKRDQGASLITKLSAPEYNKIVAKVNSIGFNFAQHHTNCRHCGYDYETTFDLSNFFASVLKTKS